MADVILKKGRDRSVWRRHPWLLSGSVARVEGDPAQGAEVRLLSAEGEVLGYGHWSPSSQIRVRLLHFGKDAPAPDALAQRIGSAVARRRDDPALADTDAVRLINAEADGLPGLVADRYGDTVVVRLSSAGMHLRRDEISAALREATGAAAGLERPDAVAARREGVAAHQGALWGSPPDSPVSIHEGERHYAVDLQNGQKTGFYLDQREARNEVQRLASGRRVLDLFAYTGGFSVAAAHGGAASVTWIDSSVDAQALAERNLEPWATTLPLRFVKADAFRFARSDTQRYDLIVVDPPPLARRAADVPKAARAYKDVLLSVLRRAEPDALVFAFSCSHHVGPDLFRKIAFGASLDAARPLQVLRELGAPPDHPVSLDHPEGCYLTGLLLRA